MSEFRYHKVPGVPDRHRVYYQRVVIIGFVEKRRHQSRRTHATGWRWFAVGRDGLDMAQDDHGYERRDDAAAVLLAAYQLKVTA